MVARSGASPIKLCDMPVRIGCCHWLLTNATNALGSGRIESRSFEAAGGSAILFFQALIRLPIFHALSGESFHAFHGKLKERRSARCPCRSDKLQCFQELMQTLSIGPRIVRYHSHFRWSLTMAVTPATDRLEK